VLGNFTALVTVNNTPVVTLAGRAHAASSWPCDSLPVSLDYGKETPSLVGTMLYLLVTKCSVFIRYINTVGDKYKP